MMMAPTPKKILNPPSSGGASAAPSIETSANTAPNISPSNPYKTMPTLNAEPGPMCLTAAMDFLPFKVAADGTQPTRPDKVSLPLWRVLAFPCAMIFFELRMTARILDGNKIRDQIFAELADEIRVLTAADIRPGLAAVLAGDNPASHLYVKSKIAACEQLGIASGLIAPPATATTLEMINLVEGLNRDNQVDGILIQLPLPPQVDTKRVLEAVDPAKDVDGFHPVNLGRLVSGRPGLVACTPAGCMEILRRNEIKIEGANAVVLGRSDIVVAAMGKAGYVEPDWIKSATTGGPGAAVIDVGTNRVTDPKEAERLFQDFPDRLAKFRAKGSALVGDVHPGAANIAGALTPVPGGVGPMTIAMLMSNTVKAARLRRASPKFSATQSTASAR